MRKKVEKTVGKEEIAHHEPISPLPAAFYKDLYCRHVKTRACLGKDKGPLEKQF